MHSCSCHLPFEIGNFLFYHIELFSAITVISMKIKIHDILDNFFKIFLKKDISRNNLKNCRACHEFRFLQKTIHISTHTHTSTRERQTQMLSFLSNSTCSYVIDLWKMSRTIMSMLRIDDDIKRCINDTFNQFKNVLKEVLLMQHNFISL